MTDSTHPNAHFDVIIAGGGLSGLTQALALSGLRNAKGESLTLAVVDKASLAPAKSEQRVTDARVLALSYASVEFLKTIGLWQQVADQAVAIDNIHVSDLGHYGKARLKAQDYHREALGYVIELDVLQQSMLLKLGQLANVTLIGNEQIVSLEDTAESVFVELSGSRLSGCIVLGCDGANSPTRKLQGITPETDDYQQVAVISNVVTEKPHHNRAFERFTDAGPLAMLPMRDLPGAVPNSSFSLVWTVSPEQAEILVSRADEDFCQQLSERFGAWQGRVITASERVCFPLKLVQTRDLVRHRYALVGNAAHTLHPIAGQGFNLGVRDIGEMSRLIKQAFERGQDIGSLSLLMRYQEKRLKDHQNVITLTDLLVHTYSNQHLPLVIGRNIGVKLLNYLTPVKTAFARFTMGK